MDVKSGTHSASSKQIISEAKRRVVVYLLTLFHLRKKMGGFLDKPKTEKSQECSEGNGLKYGVVSMQGWRVEMEDSHAAVIGLPAGFKGIMNVKSLLFLNVPRFIAKDLLHLATHHFSSYLSF